MILPLSRLQPENSGGQVPGPPLPVRAPRPNDARLTFETLDTLRHRLSQRAGRLARVQGKFTLSRSGNKKIKEELLNFLDCVKKAV